jgi:hypothetical protein
LKYYVEEISNEYANLLYFSIDILKELLEIRLVKNSLFEYLQIMKEEKRALIKENNEFSRKINSINYVNEHLISERDELRRSQIEMQDEIRKYAAIKDELKEENKKLCKKINITQSDLIDLKLLYSKEIDELQSEIVILRNERVNSVSMLKQLKDLFENSLI